jgi:hypothetical protein
MGPSLVEREFSDLIITDMSEQFSSCAQTRSAGDGVGNAPHIAFLVTDGFAARMMLRAGVPKHVIDTGTRVTAISPNADEDYFQRECHLEGINLEQAPSVRSRVTYFFRGYRQYFLDDVMNNPALRAGHGTRFKTRPLTGFTMEAINRTIGQWSLFRSFYRAFELRVNQSKRIKKLLGELRPDLLVIPNPFGSEAAVYLLHARELGIPVVCQMLSWDNITSKGTPLLMPDYFISWGPIMSEEMVEWYHFPREKIYECGVPHFDVYTQETRFIPRSVLLKELNLSSNYPYIFYGMVPEYSCPNELDILSWLADRVNRNAFSLPCALVIRPHPQTISGLYAQDAKQLDRLKALVGPRVSVDYPPVLSEQLAWDLPRTDMYRLASLLAGCAMCLSANSTLSLDACMLDRPVINIAFDGWEELPYERSARRGLNYIHMAKLLSFGGIQIASSFGDLQRNINAYLINPSMDQKGRIVSAARECGTRDGRAAERVAKTLLELASRSEERRFQDSSNPALSAPDLEAHVTR